jgi:hypothetical protein
VVDRPLTTVHISDNNGNLVINGERFTQNYNAGIDVAQLLDFAGGVRQMLPVLGLDGSTKGDLAKVAEDLHAEASSPAPDRGAAAHRWVDSAADRGRRRGDKLESRAPHHPEPTGRDRGDECLWQRPVPAPFADQNDQASCGVPLIPSCRSRRPARPTRG